MDPITFSAIITVIGGIWGFFKHKSEKTRKIDQILQQWVPLIYDEINNRILQEPQLKGADKRRLFKEKFGEIAKSQGITITPEIEKQALSMADALHYRQHNAAGTKKRKRPAKVKSKSCEPCNR